MAADGSVTFGRPRQEPHKLRKPKSLRLNDSVGRSKVPWGYDEPSGCYFASLTKEENAILLKNPRSGLYHGAIIRDEILTRAYEGALPLSEAVGHIHHIIAANGLQGFIDKNLPWRKQQPTPEQLKFLAWKDHNAYILAKEEHWNKGEVSTALTWAVIRGSVRRAKELLHNA